MLAVGWEEREGEEEEGLERRVCEDLAGGGGGGPPPPPPHVFPDRGEGGVGGNDGGSERCVTGDLIGGRGGGGAAPPSPVRWVPDALKGGGGTAAL